jgi:hypothetical protein
MFFVKYEYGKTVKAKVLNLLSVIKFISCEMTTVEKQVYIK